MRTGENLGGVLPIARARRRQLDPGTALANSQSEELKSISSVFGGFSRCFLILAFLVRSILLQATYFAGQISLVYGVLGTYKPDSI